MAKDNGNGTVTVEYGDTLWNIAEKYLGSGAKYQQLATWNNIENPRWIVVGQIIKIRKDGGSSGSNTTTTTSSNQAKITAFGLQAGTDNTIFAKWEWNKSNTDHYKVRWWYGTSDGQGFVGSDSTTEHAHATYSPPSNATKVTFFVMPISKTYTKNNAETSYWTAIWSNQISYYMKDNPPQKPSNTPEIKIVSEMMLNISIDGLENINAEKIDFEIVANDSYILGRGQAVIKTGKATYSVGVPDGLRLKVRCRAVRGELYSEWTGYSQNISSNPKTPREFITIKAASESSVYLEWYYHSIDATYELEYTTKLSNFDTTNQVESITGIENTKYTVTGLEPGEEYFFRLIVVNTDNRKSQPSKPESVIVGKRPSAPTTWSSTTTCITGEELILYWVHNSEDGSSQTFAELALTIDGVEQVPITIKNSEDEEEKDRTSSYIVDTSKFKEGTKIQWKVRTAGITYNSTNDDLGGYGDWSIERTVDIYARPVFERFELTNSESEPVYILTSFPLYVYGIPGPVTQRPIGYHLTVTPNSAYTTVDELGNEKYVNSGEEIYSKFFDTNESLLVELSANNINLEVNIEYTVTCVVSMDSGLTATTSAIFTPSWADVEYSPDAEIGYDAERYVTSIRPYCISTELATYIVEYDFNNGYLQTDTKTDDSLFVDDAIYTETGEQVYVGVNNLGLELYYCTVYLDSEGNPIDETSYEVSYSSGVYSVTDKVVDISTITDVLTDTGAIVEMGVDNNGDEIRYCTVEETKLVEDMTLSLYRREFDGTFTEIATGLDNTENTYVTDPHPALDYARYRVVAKTNSTGDVSYYDVPGFPTGEKAVIIQWDEEWTNFNTEENNVLTEPTWAGSLLRLPYNIDVSDANAPDVTLINYIGRKRPVSYYGTHLGETATWNVEIPKDDKDTLYALRRLAIWMGDVYVREPSGSGYWANIKVSYSQKHKEVTIPITLSITRVEGGM